MVLQALVALVIGLLGLQAPGDAIYVFAALSLLLAAIAGFGIARTRRA